ncbi:MAG: VWA domain-containing protein [Flavobacteriales bacterium]|nr:VWA domain-containing protein [Flavobacteriales bacterium]
MSAPGTYRNAPISMVVIAVEVLAWAIGISFLLYAPSELPQFRFAKPVMLWASFVGPVLVLAYLIGLRLKNRALKRFGEAGMLPVMVPGVSSWRTATRFLLLRHGLGLAIIALAGPQMGTRVEEVKAKGVDVVVALDVSNSMMAEDLKPNRMEVAKRALAQLIDRMHGDRLGIVVFAGQAYTQLPITADRSAAKLFLGSLGPNMVQRQGTAIGAAIDQAMRSFGADAAKGKTIIVISDGESFEDDGVTAAKEAAEKGIIVNTIGMGSPQGAPIPVRMNGAVVGFKKDKEGQTVMTKLDEGMLSRIAEAGNGEYVHATSGDTGIDAIMAKLRSMDQSDLGTFRFAGHEDRFQYFLAAACALVLIGLCMGERTFANPFKKHIGWSA